MGARVITIIMIVAFGWSGDVVDISCTRTLQFAILQYVLNVYYRHCCNALYVSTVLVIRRIRGINAYTCGHAVMMYIWTGNATAAITRVHPRSEGRHRRRRGGGAVPRRETLATAAAKTAVAAPVNSGPSLISLIDRLLEEVVVSPPPTILNIYCNALYTAI